MTTVGLRELRKDASAIVRRVRAILYTGILIATDVSPISGESSISVASLAELHFGVLVTDDAAVRAE